MWRTLVSPGYCACIALIAALSVILLQASVYKTHKALLPLKITVFVIFASVDSCCILQDFFFTVIYHSYRKTIRPDDFSHFDILGNIR